MMNFGKIHIQKFGFSVQDAKVPVLINQQICYQGNQYSPYIAINNIEFVKFLR